MYKVPNITKIFWYLFILNIGKGFNSGILHFTQLFIFPGVSSSFRRSQYLPTTERVHLMHQLGFTKMPLQFKNPWINITCKEEKKIWKWKRKNERNLSQTQNDWFNRYNCRFTVNKLLNLSYKLSIVITLSTSSYHQIHVMGKKIFFKTE